MNKNDKTNVMRILDQHGIDYRSYFAETKEALSAKELANAIHVDEKKVYKTLVTTSKSRKNYVFIMRADQELDLKKAARCTGEKSIEMIKSKELLPLTGYVHGGCSPIGMKKPLETYIDESVLELDSFICSGGKIGCQIEISLADLNRIIKVIPCDLHTDI